MKHIEPNIHTEIRVYRKRKNHWSPEYRLYINRHSLLSFLLRKVYVGKSMNKLDTVFKGIIFINKNNYIKIAFLRGLFDAEGGLYWQPRHACEIKISNALLSLQKIASNILNQLNIKHTFTIDKRIDKRHKLHVYYIRIFGKNARKFIKTVKPYKLLIQDYVNAHVHEKYRKCLKGLIES